MGEDLPYSDGEPHPMPDTSVLKPSGLVSRGLPRFRATALRRSEVAPVTFPGQGPKSQGVTAANHYSWVVNGNGLGT